MRQRSGGIDKSSTSTDPGTTWKNDKNTITHHIQESQEVSPFPAGDHNAAINRRNIDHNKNDLQGKHRIGTVSKIPLPEGLN